MNSVAAGAVTWALFAAFGTEPWDTSAGWIVMAGLGFYFGYWASSNPVLWPLGILIGQTLWGFGTLLKDLFFYSGGGANLFWPVGLMMLLPFTVPALLASLIGALIAKRRAIRP